MGRLWVGLLFLVSACEWETPGERGQLLFSYSNNSPSSLHAPLAVGVTDQRMVVRSQDGRALDDAVIELGAEGVAEIIDVAPWDTYRPDQRAFTLAARAPGNTPIQVWSADGELIDRVNLVAAETDHGRIERHHADELDDLGTFSLSLYSASGRLLHGDKPVTWKVVEGAEQIELFSAFDGGVHYRLLQPGRAVVRATTADGMQTELEVELRF